MTTPTAQADDAKGMTDCARCQKQPVAERVGSYWRVRCPNHSKLTGTVSGHTMKTKKAAIREWNRLMNPPEPPLTEAQVRDQDSLFGVLPEENHD